MAADPGALLALIEQYACDREAVTLEAHCFPGDSWKNKQVAADATLAKIRATLGVHAYQPPMPTPERRDRHWRKGEPDSGPGVPPSEQQHDYPACALFRGGPRCTCVCQDPPDGAPAHPALAALRHIEGELDQGLNCSLTNIRLHVREAIASLGVKGGGNA